MNNDNSTPTPNGQAPNGTDPTSQALASNGQAPNETPNNNAANDDLLRQIKELRSENASHRKKAQEQTQVAQAAEEARLKEQGEFKKLAEKHEARVKELEPVASQYSQLAELVSGQIESQIKDWPAELKAFDPGKDSPIEQRLAWLEKSKPLLEKLMQQVRSQSPGNAPSPRPASPNGSKDVDELRTRYRESGKYGF
jgi:hypothetical protein